jgi:hypothetical protein
MAKKFYFRSRDTKVYVVATVTNPYNDDDDLFADIILITLDKQKARKVLKRVKERKPIRGLNYNWLAGYEGVVLFERDLNKTLVNKGD